MIRQALYAFLAGQWAVMNAAALLAQIDPRWHALIFAGPLVALIVDINRYHHWLED